MDVTILVLVGVVALSIAGIITLIILMSRNLKNCRNDSVTFSPSSSGASVAPIKSYLKLLLGDSSKPNSAPMSVYLKITPNSTTAQKVEWSNDLSDASLLYFHIASPPKSVFPQIVFDSTKSLWVDIVFGYMYFFVDGNKYGLVTDANGDLYSVPYDPANPTYIAYCTTENSKSTGIISVGTNAGISSAEAGAAVYYLFGTQTSTHISGNTKFPTKPIASESLESFLKNTGSTVAFTFIAAE